MINQKELCKFLVKAKKSTYAAGDAAKSTMETDKSKTLVFEDGDWKYHDNYFGGEPYGGREVVFFQNQPVYMMVYYGWVNESVTDFESVYGVLRGALTLISEGKPFRGPEKFAQDGLEYINIFEGEVDNFHGEEIIQSSDAKELYKQRILAVWLIKGNKLRN